MPTALDIAFAVFFTVIITAFDTIYFVPKFKAEVNAGVPNARLHAYRRTVLGQWLFAAAAILLWMRSGRPWSELGIDSQSFSRMSVDDFDVVDRGSEVEPPTTASGSRHRRRGGLRPKLASSIPASHSRRASGSPRCRSRRRNTKNCSTADFCSVLKAYVGTALAALIGDPVRCVAPVSGTRSAFAGMAGLR
jgi:hypothetical protein